MVIIHYDIDMKPKSYIIYLSMKQSTYLTSQGRWVYIISNPLHYTDHNNIMRIYDKTIGNIDFINTRNLKPTFEKIKYSSVQLNYTKTTLPASMNVSISEIKTL